MFIASERILKRTLELSVSGTRGGFSRLRILMLLRKSPRNVNEIARSLSMDYKTAQHHVRVLEKSFLIVSGRKKYGNAYELSEILKSSKGVLDAIWEKVDKLMEGSD